MANRFPLVIDTTNGNKLAELPAGDNLDLRESSIVRVQDVDALGTINAADITVNGNRLVAQTFIDLTDTPLDYTNSADKFLKVNAAGDGIEFRPFSDIGNIEVEEIEVGTRIVPATAGTVDIGTGPLYFNRVTANEFMGDIITADESRVFNAATGEISYAALAGAPTQLSEFENDVGYLLTSDLDSSLAALFDEGAVFDTDIKGSVFGQDSSMIVDGVASEVVGVVNNTTITTVNLTATTATSTTSISSEYTGPSNANNVINAQNDYDVVIGENNTSNTIIHNGQADSLGLESGIGIAELNAVADLYVRAGNRVKFVETPVRFSTYTDAEAAFIVAQNGDVIYNTDQNRFQLYQNGAWVDLHKGIFDGNVSSTAGESNFNDVVIAGNLTVEGTTTSIETTNTTITDNVIVLNEGEVGAGITATTAGIEIDRGSESNVTFVYDDSVDKWTLGTETLVAGAFEGNLTGNVVATDIEIDGATSRLTFDSLTAPEIRNRDGSVRVVLFGDDYSPGTAQLYVNANDVWLYSTLNVEQSAFIKGEVTAAAFKGTFVGDDSTVLVDGNNNKVLGDVENTEVITSTVQGRAASNLNIYRGAGGTVSLGDASSGDVSVSDSGINITSTAGVNVNGAAGSTVDIGTSATTGNVTIGKAGNTTTIDGTFNATLTGDVTGNVTGDVAGDVTGNIDNATLSIGATTATAINIGNGSSTTTITGNLALTNALIVNNLTADDSISITTEGNTSGEAISIGPGGSNTFINLTANSIRLFGPVTTSIAAQGGVVGDLKGSVVADDSTVLVDAVNGIIPKANIEGVTNWDTAYSWGDHSTVGYLQDGGSFQGDVQGSVFADDSSVMVNAVDFTMAADVISLTPLNAEPTSPVNGMVAVADGTGWDPHSTGVNTMTVYLGGAWRQIAAAV